MTAWIGLIGAIAALITGLAALISSVRGHRIVNNEIRPHGQANTSAVLRLAEDASSGTEADVRKIVNGAAPDGG